MLSTIKDTWIMKMDWFLLKVKHADNNTDNVFVELSPINVIIGCVYRKPNTDINNFTIGMDNLLSRIVCPAAICVVPQKSRIVCEGGGEACGYIAL